MSVSRTKLIHRVVRTNEQKEKYIKRHTKRYKYHNRKYWRAWDKTQNALLWKRIGEKTNVQAKENK